MTNSATQTHYLTQLLTTKPSSTTVHSQPTNSSPQNAIIKQIIKHHINSNNTKKRRISTTILQNHVSYPLNLPATLPQPQANTTKHEQFINKILHTKAQTTSIENKRDQIIQPQTGRITTQQRPKSCKPTSPQIKITNHRK